MICHELARLITEERSRQGFSMTVLGKRCKLSQQSISYIERGMRIPNLDTLIAIADELGMKPSELLAKAEVVASE